MYLNGKYTKVTKAALPIASDLANGCYQYGLLRNGEAWSGATLTGRAKKYGGHYRDSRENFFARLRGSRDLRVMEDVLDHGRRVVLIVTAEEAATHGGCWETLRAYDAAAEERRREEARKRLAEKIEGALFVHAEPPPSMLTDEDHADLAAFEVVS